MGDGQRTRRGDRVDRRRRPGPVRNLGDRWRNRPGRTLRCPTPGMAPGHRLRVAHRRRPDTDRAPGRRRWIRAVANAAAGSCHRERDRIRAPLPDAARPAPGRRGRDRAHQRRRRRYRPGRGRPRRVADEGRQDDSVAVARPRLQICRRRRVRVRRPRARADRSGGIHERRTGRERRRDRRATGNVRRDRVTMAMRVCGSLAR